MRRALLILSILLLACGPFFYEAPPNIAVYPERIATKKWHQLFLEAAPLNPALPDKDALDETCRKLPELLASLDPNQRLDEIDRRLEENRQGPYLAGRANFLHELRELAGNPTGLDAAGEYLAWRVSTPARLKAPPMECPWSMKEAEYASLQVAYEAQIADRAQDITQRISVASPELQPNWMVQLGALRFDTGQYVEAGEMFAAVTTDWPGHPRAEAAALMLARSKIEIARVLAKSKADADRALSFLRLDEAEKLLTEFIQQHPKGRFTPDALGWLGAIASDRKQYGLAVKYQLERLDLQPTREITRSVLRECDALFEKCFLSPAAIDSDPWINSVDHFDAAAVARHPLAARLFVQHCIDPALNETFPLYWDQGFDGGRATINFLNRRILSSKPFVQLALGQLANELVATGTNADATTLTLLAWVATESGEHEQALGLLDLIPATDPVTDEMLHARAMVLYRMERHAEAVIAFDALADGFPESPLTSDVAFHRAVSLFKSGQAGRAIINFCSMNFSEEPESNIQSDQISQWLDTLLQFAPLEQLEQALAGVPADSMQAELICQFIRVRALADERFDIALEHLSSEEKTSENYDGFSRYLEDVKSMSRTEWDQHAAPLAALYQELKTTRNDPARIQLDIARLWMANRGVLTLPGVALCYYAHSEEEKQEQLRRRNALWLGLSPDRVDAELDGRDEATRALQYAILAARSQDPTIAAPALELANQCLFRRAEFSLYQKSRALESGMNNLSREIYRQLIKRFPDSPEAHRAVYFTFGPIAGEWMPGDYNPNNSATRLTVAILGGNGEMFDYPDEVENEIQKLLTPLNAIDAGTPMTQVVTECEKLRKKLNSLRPGTNLDYQDGVLSAINRLDELHAAASLPGIQTADFINYIQNPKASDLPGVFRSLQDYQYRIESIPKPGNYLPTRRNDTAEGWEEFLNLYPESPLAEAASFRRVRLIARQNRAPRKIGAFYFPDAPIPHGYKQVQPMRSVEGASPATVLDEIQRHEARFPDGRYQDDVKLLRAGALIETGEFSAALELIEEILSNPVQRDLHVLAALDFADIAQRLLKPESRLPVALAMRANPAALKRLRALVKGDTFLSRLEPLLDWLETQA